MAWWIGVLFAVGSVCFALGSFPPYATAVGTNADNLTYFIGSIFFTTASFFSTTRRRRRQTTLEGAARRGLALLAHGPAPPDRLVGLGASSSSAPSGSTGPHSARSWSVWERHGHHPIWRPDALGSVCFLVSSWLAWAEECHGRFAWRPASDLVVDHRAEPGRFVAFGVSAVASYVKPNGHLVSLALTNLGTFVGAVCFLVGAILLLPERTLERPPGGAAVAHPDVSSTQPDPDCTGAGRRAL